ncbi:MAG: hypothetical protein Q8L88_13995 [Bacteroidota bacterium]|nr:hypothetical protein [Bacteroidota bacterium]
MKTFVFFFFCMMLMVGCTSTYTVGSKVAGDDYDLDQFNSHIEKQKCTVILSTGEEKKIQGIILSRDSVSWNIPSEIRISSPKSQISQMQTEYSGYEKGKILTFKNGQTKVVGGVIVTHDSISWIEPTMLTVSVPTSQVRKIIYVNRSRGFFEGLWKGALSGLLVGGVTAGLFSNSGVPETVIVLNVGGVILLISPIVGAIIGHTEEFRFKNTMTSN